jgi:hypothetical protein
MALSEISIILAGIQKVLIGISSWTKNNRIISPYTSGTEQKVGVKRLSFPDSGIRKYESKA